MFDDGWVAKAFRPVDRAQQFLLPVDLADWLPADHQVWLVLDVVEQLDLRALTARYALGGVGRRAYDPAMMLALLVYGYVTGVRSSRAIERACHSDVAFRIVCALDPPDHTQIARFRQAHLDLFEDLFTQVLIVCARLGYVRLGIVAIDGTKIAANASIDASHERAFYAAKVAAMSAEAERVDAAEDAQFGPDRRGDEPPDAMQLSGRGQQARAERAARLRRCLQEITAAETERAELSAQDRQAAAEYLAAARSGAPGQARLGRPPRGVTAVEVAQARVERDTRRYGPEHRYTRRSRRDLATAEQATAEQATAEQATAEQATAEQAGQRPKTRKPCKHGTRCRRRGCLPPPIRRNSTDPDSRLMPTRRGFTQGYNAQLAASQDHFIIAVDLVQDTGDVNQYQPMTGKAVHAADQLRPHRPEPDTTTDETDTTNEAGDEAGDEEDIATIGIVLADNGYCSEANLTADGPDRLIATGKGADLTTAATTQPTSGPPPDHATPVEAMRHRLRTPQGATRYKQRGATIEPINGNLKDRGNLRTFLLRGLHACHAELTLAALAHNLRHLHNQTRPA